MVGFCNGGNLLGNHDGDDDGAGAGAGADDDDDDDDDVCMCIETTNQPSWRWLPTIHFFGSSIKQ